MRILVGSRAVHHWYNGFRDPEDTDYFAPEKQTGEGKVETFWHEDIEKHLPDLTKYFVYGDVDINEWIATPDFLYTLKVSHVFWAGRNGKWRKHMSDIRWFQERTGAQFVPEIYDIFYPIWEQRFGKKKANLNVSPEDFFTKTVDRKYDHDSIHASVAYGDRARYFEILKDGEDVMVDKAKWDALPYEWKCQMVREECYATALERQIIPSNYTASPRAAYGWAMMKTITSFSKGWFPLFIVLNYNKLAKPDVNYVQVHKDNSDRLILL